jgi:hypothetical protein
MSSNDDTYLASLRTHAAETRTLFSNPMKPERERMVVRAYLRCLGIPFTEDEIASSNDEPVDVLFGEADSRSGTSWATAYVGNNGPSANSGIKPLRQCPT